MWKLELSELQPLWIHRYRCETRVPRRPYRVGRLGWRDKLTLWRCKSDIRHFFTIVGDFSPQGQNSQRQNSKKPTQARLLQLSSNVSHGQMNLISCSPTDGIVTCLLNRVISKWCQSSWTKTFFRGIDANQSTGLNVHWIFSTKLSFWWILTRSAEFIRHRATDPASYPRQKTWRWEVSGT